MLVLPVPQVHKEFKAIQAQLDLQVHKVRLDRKEMWVLQAL
jgi:hypothetical protein